MTAKIVRKTIEEAKKMPMAEIDFSYKNLLHLEDCPQLFELSHVTRLTLAHNKMSYLSEDLAKGMAGLEILNLCGNGLDRLPGNLHNLRKLRILNLSNNRLGELPDGFGLFRSLEILDLSYNYLNSMPERAWGMETLRALYLSDNDFKELPCEVQNLKNLEILALRDNRLSSLPEEIGTLAPTLRELHLQGNHLRVLPPQLCQLDPSRLVVMLGFNAWETPLSDNLFPTAKLVQYLDTKEYKEFYEKHKATMAEDKQQQQQQPPPPSARIARGSKKRASKK